MKPFFLVVDKPAGITSHDVVAAVRAVTGAKKVGHTGTLDPFATGVLPLAVGGATRLIQYLDEKLKVYDAVISLGTLTDTGDPTGTVTDEKVVPAFTEPDVLAVLEGMVGPQMQKPPAYSAVKKNGKALYKYARAGEVVEVPARPITIYGLELLAMDASTLTVRIRCSRGTYARVLANDIAMALGTVGHLSALSRLQSGPFLMDQAVDFPTLASLVSAEPDKTWQEVLLKKGRPKDAPRVKWKPRDTVLDDLKKWAQEPIACLGHLPPLEVDADVCKIVKAGGAPPSIPANVDEGGRFLIVRGERIVAIGESTPAGPKTERTF